MLLGNGFLPMFAATDLAGLLSDNFTTTLGAGAINGTGAEPGPGTRTINAADGSFSVAGGRLQWTAQTTPVWGDLRLAYVDIAIQRTAGRMFFARGVTITQTNKIGWIGLNSIAAATTAGGSQSLVFWFSNTINAYPANAPCAVFVPGTAYDLCISQLSIGNLYYIKGGAYTEWTLIFIDHAQNTATQYPVLVPYDAAGSLDAIEIIDVAGWATSTGPVLESITSAFSGQTITATADGVLECTWTVATGETLEISWRASSANDRWILRCAQAAGTIRLYKREGGIETEYDTGKTQAWNNAQTYRVNIFYHGSAIRIFVNDIAKNVYLLATFNSSIPGATISGGASVPTFISRSGLYGTGSYLATTSATAPTVSLSQPVSYQVHQRDSSGQADIAIVGTFAGPGTHDIEARFNGGAWVTIATSVAAGAFTGTLNNQSAGEGTLEVRLTDWIYVADQVRYVGIGEVFVIAGQSNAVGYGTDNQTYAHATIRGGIFGNDYIWRQLADPVDLATNQVDSVSDDGLNARGSVWPLVATSLAANQNVPVAFIPCAKGGTAITSWLPAANRQDRTTLYGSMIYRALQASGSNGVRAVLWWQGEANLASPIADYNAWLDTVANSVNADLGCKLMAPKLQNTIGDETNVNAAVAQAWADNANVLTGPDLSGLTTDDSYHLQSNANLSAAASLWWASIRSAFGW